MCIICTLTDVLSDYTLQICPKLSMTWGTTKLGMRVLQVKQQIYSFNQKKTMTWETTKLDMRVLHEKQQIYSFNQKEK